jgi:amidase
MSELAFDTARALAAKLRKREISSLELVDHFLARIERHNPALLAVITLDAERARAAARRADEALARGEVWGPLHGIPMTIKDAFEVAGLRTTAGAKVWKDHVSTTDAVAVQRLRAAGAVIMGKTNVPAFCADLQSYNATFGTTNNPWDLTRTPGGSSGGATAALAAGLTPIELGSDIGGSIRTPASWSGVYGHKPSYGIVPYRGHLPGPPGTLAAPDLSVVGPLARSTDDLALLLDVLAGPLPEQAKAFTLQLPVPRATTLRGYRVATWFHDPTFPIDSALGHCLEHAADTLRHAGARVEAARPAFELKHLHEVYRGLLDPIMSTGLPPAPLARLHTLAAGPDPQQPLTYYARNALRTHREWLALDEERERLRFAFRNFFEDHDVLLCPVTLLPAIAHDHSEPLGQRSVQVNGQIRSYMDLFGWAGLATACYLPATVIPVGRTGGLPVGIQIIGPYLEDRTTLDLAGRLSELVGGFVPPPGY